MAAGGGPTQRMPGLDHALGEVGVLREEAEAGVEGVGVRSSSGGDDGFGVQEVDRRPGRPWAARPLGCRADRTSA